MCGGEEEWRSEQQVRVFHKVGASDGLDKGRGNRLETRRLRGDQIEVFKIVNGYEDVDRNMFFKLKEGSRTRGHKAALVKE